MLRKLSLVVCGVLVGCNGFVEPERQVEEPTAEDLTVEFDGRVWTATRERAPIRSVVMWGWVCVGDQEGERLLAGINDEATGSAARVAFEIQRQFGREWLAAGASAIIAANGERDELTFWKGQLHGERRCYLPDGTMHRLQNFHFGKPHGPQKTWYENGQPWEDSVYMDGVRIHGRYWRENGTELTGSD